MKKYGVLAVMVAAILFMPLAAHADPKDLICKLTDNKAKGCEQPKTVPEPGDLMLLSSGLASVGALSLLRRKGQSK